MLTSPLMRFIREEQATISIEYSLMASLIAMMILGSVVGMGKNLGSLYDNFSSKIISALGG